MRKSAKIEARKRLSRMEGQVRGILNMIEDDRDCSEVLIQVAALRAALEGLGSLVVTQHLEEILSTSGVLRGDAEVEEKVSKVRDALNRLIR